MYDKDANLAALRKALEEYDRPGFVEAIADFIVAFHAQDGEEQHMRDQLIQGFDQRRGNFRLIVDEVLECWLTRRFVNLTFLTGSHGDRLAFNADACTPTIYYHPDLDRPQFGRRFWDLFGDYEVPL